MSPFLRVAPRLPTRNLAESIRWYTTVLGFESGAPWPAEAPTFVLLEREGVSVQFNLLAEPPAQLGEVMLSFDVSDATGLHRSLAGVVPVEWGPEVYWYGRREFAVRDPNGYLLIFSEETTDPPTETEE